MPGKSKVHSFLETVWAFNQLSKEQQNSIAEGMEKFTEETERQRLALLAAAPTLSEAGACPECHRSDRHEEGCPWDRPPSAKLSDSEKASWNEDLNAKKWDG